MRFFHQGLLAGLLFLAPVELLAQNVSSGTAVRLTIGQQAVVQNLANNTSQGWFNFQPRPGRSYCASVTFSHISALASGMTQGDPVVTVFQSDGTTVVAITMTSGRSPTQISNLVRASSGRRLVMPGSLGLPKYPTRPIVMMYASSRRRCSAPGFSSRETTTPSP